MIDQMSAFLQKLRASTAGNTLAIAAAALVPLVGMVGGAVDISRYYMAVSRMQNACDAGALAARKQMESGEFEDVDRDLGLRFFDQNYPDGTFGLENLDRDYVADEDGAVTGTATGEMPTTIMQIFGKEGMDISVSCSAEINISNTDIMFVLDVTGSMNCPDDGSWCPGSNNNNVEADNARIRGLRTAVVNFYDAVDEATSSAAQVRYGIVPYASNINVGASIPSTYMATSHTYQSREAETHLEEWWQTLSTNVQNPSNLGSESFVGYGPNWDRVSGNVWSQSACDNYAPADTGPDYVDGSLDQGSLSLISESQSGNVRTRVYEGSGTLRRGDGIGWWDGNRRCYRNHAYYDRSADFDITIVDEWNSQWVFDRWVYKPLTYDISNIVAGNSTTWRIGDNWTNLAVSWNDGCIEEAQSVATATWDPIPAGAYDLDINLKPTTNDQQWKPVLRNLVWKRENPGNQYSWLYQTGNESRPSYDCPKAAFRLTEIDRADLESYLLASNGFIARSNTYHDIGMIWGARFISPRGIFEDDNETAPNGDSIARHIVFMTDGVLMVDDEIYGTYGIEWWDRRVSSDGSNSSARHAARFQAACRKAREENISVWVVAFGTTLSQNLIDCATPGRAYSATDGDSLNTAFQEIAQKIAALRLTS